MKPILPMSGSNRWLLPILLVAMLQPMAGAGTALQAWLCPFALHDPWLPDDIGRTSGIGVLLPPVINPAGPFCANAPNTTLTATPPGGTWSGTGITNPVTGVFSPATAGAGSHTITYTDPGGSSSSITIVVWSAPNIVFISGDGTDCNGEATGNTILTVSGGTQFAGPVGCKYHYDWDWDGTGYNDDYGSPCAGGIDPEDLSNLPAGTYTVTVTDLNGCSTTGMVLVDEPPAIEATADDVELDCFGETGVEIDLTVTGGTGTHTYDWDWDGTGANDDFGGPPSNTLDEEDPEIIGPGVYSVTVTDFLGCTVELQVTVTEPDELEADATSESVLCSGGSSGEIDLTVTGGTPGYLYDWDYDGTGDNNDPQDPTGLPAGTYSVTVTDANGCTTATSVVVDEPSEPVDASVTAIDVSCFGEADGSIDLTPSGGTGNYTFDWDYDGTGDNDDPEDPQDLDPGPYSVTVTDANGCTAVATVSVNEPPEITGVHNETICAGGSVTINGTVYDENNTSGTEVFTAANGCDSTVTVTITFDPPLEGEETYTGCEGDGYEVVIGGITFNQGNPSGSVTISTADGCDSIVTVSLEFLEAVMGSETYSGCEGDGYEVIVNGTPYNEGNPIGQETLVSQAGCDSIVDINLDFASATEYEITNEGCEGDGYSVVVNGTVYDESNPSGVEVIQNAAGCDSTITINLFFGEPSESEVTYSGCSGDGYSVVVNGTIYDEDNPSGVEVTVNADGCDSTITVTLTFLPPTTAEVNYTGCQGDGYEVIVNGTIYNESNPFGTDTLVNGAGCDSIVTTNLVFQEPVYGLETYTGCTGDGYSVVVGGIVFDENNPTGTVTLVSGMGCDSIVEVSLVFNNTTSSSIDYEGCQGDGYSIIVNGTIYNENNPTGVEVIPNAMGCDSTITITLVFDTPNTGSVTYQGCEGDGYSVVVNGTTYDETHPMGTEVLTNAAGCDSTVTIQLTFESPDTTLIVHNGCVGDGFSVVVNGTTYDESNQDGQETMTGSNGCDSIILVDLNFTEEIITLIDPLLCDGDFIIVNGTVYDQNNPSGTELFVAQGGCDSVVYINLSFLPPLTGEYYPDVCQGGFIIVNGTIYDENNPSGTEVFTSAQGCDSTVTVEINILPPLTGEFFADICEGGSIVVNGTTYDESHPSGLEIFVTPAGCDSIVTVEIGFLPPVPFLFTYEGCVGDGYFVIVNGNLYDEQHPEGEEQFQAPSGCDSIVVIDLNFNSTGSSEILYSGCTGDGYSVIVNSVVYDEANPSGFEYVQTPFGCDSLVTIELMFAQPDTGYIDYTGCLGDGYEVIVNGNVYDEDNPTGVEVVQTPAGCDSVVVIDLDFLEGIETYLYETVCAGGSIMIGGIIFDPSHPADTLYLQAAGGCDSTVFIEVDFLPPLTGTETYTGCQGDGYSVVVNGIVYNESNPSGIEFFQNADGCDTIVTIDLVFGSTVDVLIDPTLCPDESIVVNGTVYDISNPSGTEVIAGQGACDTTVLIDLDFWSVDTTHVDYSGCQGDGYSVVVNGVQYDESNPAGIEQIPDPHGCDSTVIVNLVFANCCVEQTVTESASICTGSTYDWRGQSLKETGIYQDTLPDAVAPGCDSIFILQLDVADVVTATFTVDICEGEDFPFGSAIYITSGVYTDTITNGSAMGCDSVNRLVLTVNAMPMVNAGPDQMITCGSPEVVLAAQAGPGTVLWSGPDITAANQDDLNPLVSKPGTYTLTITSPAGCTASDQVVVSADSTVPISDAGPDQAITCDNPAAVLQGSVAGQNLSWRWEGPGISGADAFILNPQVTQAGTYVLFLQDTVNLCEAAPDTVLVEDIRKDLMAVAVAETVQPCGVALNATGSSAGAGLVHEWFDAAGNLISNSLYVQLSGPGTYQFIVSDPLSGCLDSTEVTVDTWVYGPDVEAGPDQVIDCRNPTATLKAVLNGTPAGLEFAWSGPPAGILGDPGQPAIVAALAGLYQLVVTDLSTGCETRDSARVTEDTQLPPANAFVDHHIDCHQTTALVLATTGAGQPELSNLWLGMTGNILGTGNQFVTDEPGQFVLEVTNTASGCQNRDTVEVFKTDAPVGTLVVTPENCAGDLQGSIMVSDVQGGMPPYTYILDGNTAQPLPFFDGLAPGFYAIQVMDDAGCTWDGEAVVEEGLDFALHIGADITLEPGETASLQATVSIPWAEIDSIQWTPQDILSCSDCPNPVLTGLYSTTVMAQAWSKGCQDEAMIQLRVDTDHDVYIPNVFTPDFDGVNDYFTVYGKKSVRQINRLEVYDRWGNHVFQKNEFPPNDPRAGWDGTFRGQALNPGVYVFLAEVLFTDGFVGNFSGDVTLIR